MSLSDDTVNPLCRKFLKTCWSITHLRATGNERVNTMVDETGSLTRESQIGAH